MLIYFQNGIKKLATDEETFSQILHLRSGAQLKLTEAVYKKRTGADLEQEIRKEFSGELRSGLLAISKATLSI